MRRPIEFDNQPGFWAVKIDNVRTYATLPAELLAEKLTVFEKSPEDSLSCCGVFTEVSTTFLGFPRIEQPRSTFVHALAKHGFRRTDQPGLRPPLLCEEGNFT